MSRLHRSRRIGWALAVGLGFAAVSGAAASDLGQALADQVTEDSYQSFMNNSLYTHMGQSRGPGGAQHDLARDNIRDLFISYGLTTRFESFWYPPSPSQWFDNVVAEKTGTLYPNSIYIVSGHFDSVSNPGADDDASGVALVLEAARILSQYPSDYTIRFIAFDMEEAGLIGSQNYVGVHRNEDIRGMISLDMVCYDPNDTDHAQIYGRTASNPIKSALAAALVEYGGLTCTINGQLDASDHAPFEWMGFQACVLSEDDVWSNPYYHTANDNYEHVGYLNWNYAVKMTRSVVGWLVDAAGVATLDFTYPYALPEFSAPPGGTVVRVETAGVGAAVPQPGTGVLHYNTGAGWQTNPMTAVSQNVYNAVLPAATCGTEILYYFSAQNIGGQTYVDPHGAPASAYTTRASYGTNLIYQNTFDSNPGWTAELGWAFGHPTGGGSHNHDPTDGHTGTNVYGYNLAGDYGNSIDPPRYLTTPAFDCTGRQYVQVEFWRWLGVESNSSYDEATVEASNDGTSWTVVWRATSTGAAVSDSAWTKQVFDVSASADNRPTFYVRWGMGPTDLYLTYPGWNIDDFALSALQCSSPWPVGDLNCDGSVSFGDINPFVLTLTDPVAWQVEYPGCPLANGDINGDGFVDFGDINPFVTLLTGGS